MTPEQREQARQRYERFRQLPPEQQERLRRRRDWFRNLPPERRAELRQRWQNMSPEERQQFRQKLRRNNEATDDFGGRPRMERPERSERPGRMMQR